MKRPDCLFVEGVPKDLRLQFKSACAKKGKSMKDVIIRLMRRYARK